MINFRIACFRELLPGFERVVLTESAGKAIRAGARSRGSARETAWMQEPTLSFRRRQGYAAVMWCLIAYSRSSAFVLTFNVSIIRYL
jgi:hypothetical protein